MSRPTLFRSQRLREQAECIRFRAAFLDPLDRELIEQVLDRGVSPSGIARQAGRTPARVRRRLHKAIGRLTDPRNVALMRRHARMEPKTRGVAELVFLKGRSVRAAARELGITYYEARRCAEGLVMAVEFDRKAGGND